STPPSAKNLLTAQARLICYNGWPGLLLKWLVRVGSGTLLIHLPAGRNQKIFMPSLQRNSSKPSTRRKGRWKRAMRFFRVKLARARTSSVF
ncbi:hypothetical protein H0H81_009873, partial [Sphagnurus paluster]